MGSYIEQQELKVVEKKNEKRNRPRTCFRNSIFSFSTKKNDPSLIILPDYDSNTNDD
jgi:hypothetical protein